MSGDLAKAITKQPKIFPTKAAIPMTQSFTLRQELKRGRRKRLPKICISIRLIAREDPYKTIQFTCNGCK